MNSRHPLDILRKITLYRRNPRKSLPLAPDNHPFATVSMKLALPRLDR